MTFIKPWMNEVPQEGICCSKYENVSAEFRCYWELPDELYKYWDFPGSVCCEQSQRCWGWRRWRSTWRSLLFSHKPLQTWSSPERKLNHQSRIGTVWYRILFGLKLCLIIPKWSQQLRQKKNNDSPSFWMFWHPSKITSNGFWKKIQLHLSPSSLVIWGSKCSFKNTSK